MEIGVCVLLAFLLHQVRQTRCVRVCEGFGDYFAETGSDPTLFLFWSSAWSHPGYPCVLMAQTYVLSSLSRVWKWHTIHHLHSQVHPCKFIPV